MIFSGKKPGVYRIISTGSCKLFKPAFSWFFSDSDSSYEQDWRIFKTSWMESATSRMSCFLSNLKTQLIIVITMHEYNKDGWFNNNTLPSTTDKYFLKIEVLRGGWRYTASLASTSLFVKKNLPTQTGRPLCNCYIFMSKLHKPQQYTISPFCFALIIIISSMLLFFTTE